MDSDNRQAVDQSLQELGAVPPEIEQLIERYVGSVQLNALQADALLNTLHVAQIAPASEPPRRPSDAAPEFSDDGDTDGPPMQRMDARLARQSSLPSPPLPAASTRHNTPFPAGLPGADEMPDIARRVPPRGFAAPIAALVTPPPAVEPEPEAEPVVATAEAQRLDVPEQSAEIPKLPHDDFEVVVDDEIVELDPEDMELDVEDR